MDHCYANSRWQIRNIFSAEWAYLDYLNIDSCSREIYLEKYAYVAAFENKNSLVDRHLRTNLPLEFSGKLKSWHEKNNNF